MDNGGSITQLRYLRGIVENLDEMVLEVLVVEALDARGGVDDVRDLIGPEDLEISCDVLTAWSTVGVW